MLKYAALTVVLLSVVCAVEYTVETCKCSEGYKAEKNLKEEVECVGVYLSHAKACNLPEMPKCVCTKDKVSGILSDNEGTWCTFSEKGENKKKWACENAADWEAYKVQLEEYDKTVKN